MITTEPAKKASRTLIRFCKIYGYDTTYLIDIRKCLNALENNNIEEAINAYKRVPLGGMGCFNDWLPSAKHQNEETQYLADLFDVLVTYWSLCMKRLCDQTENRGN